jgi:GNAT superfamily N-acetyltransferase
MARLEYRKLLAGDVGEVAELLAGGFAGFREFAPRYWRAPEASGEIPRLAGWVDDPVFWGQLARDGPVLAGAATFVPATRHHVHPDPDPELVHLAHLFVKPQYWGTGAARSLLHHAMRGAAGRGFTAMRLYTPAGQARARRFYEREGFAAAGGPQDRGLGLPVIEYRRPLPTRARPTGPDA